MRSALWSLVCQAGGLVWRWAILVIVCLGAFVFAVWTPTGWLRAGLAACFLILIVSYVTVLREVDDLRAREKERKRHDESKRWHRP